MRADIQLARDSPHIGGVEGLGQRSSVAGPQREGPVIEPIEAIERKLRQGLDCAGGCRRQI